MTEDRWDLSKWDWKSLGLRSGVEIHQQLFTQRKLFCRCPAGLYSDHHDAQVLRHMRPTLSELGEYDGTALMEFKTKKEIVYLLNSKSVCTYEMDDTPPFEINRQAIDYAMEVALSLGCCIVGELHVIRKQYLDGSIPAGFQRTAIVGVDGGFPLGGRRVRITHVNIEEDACREVSDIGHRIVFRTDRLSMPLTEIVTAADMRTPEEVAQAVRLLGDAMRLTGKVRSGMGAARQDVNVSVEGGTRVEIKGVPSVKLIPALVGYEAIRQHILLSIRDAARKLGVHEDEGYGRKSLITRQLDRYGADGLAGKALAEGAMFGAVRLPGFRDLLATQVGPGRSLLDEIRGRVRVVACLTQEPYAVPFEQFKTFGLAGETTRKIRRYLRVRQNDGLLLVWGPEQDVHTAMEEICIRVREAAHGVPNETRQVLPGGVTDFERILPGPDRMYPDTDSPPLAIPDPWLERIRGMLVESLWDREESLRKLGTPEPKIRGLAKSSRLGLFRELTGKLGVSPVFASVVLTEIMVNLERRGVDVEAITGDHIAELFEAILAGRLYREAIVPVLTAMADKPDDGLVVILGRLEIRLASQDWAERQVDEILDCHPQPDTMDPEARMRYWMGHCMRRLRGSYSGKGLLEILADRLSSDESSS
jgi:glutamyl-tRNA(Gln) amidotransferase subunit E